MQVMIRIDLICWIRIQNTAIPLTLYRTVPYRYRTVPVPVPYRTNTVPYRYCTGTVLYRTVSLLTALYRTIPDTVFKGKSQLLYWPRSAFFSWEGEYVSIAESGENGCE
jgi:hypothetical protein